MPNSSQDRRPILPYPSWASVAELVIAMIERSSGAVRPDDWPAREPLFLKEEDVIDNKVFREAIDGAIGGAEPGGWLSQELEYFELIIAEDVLESLESDTSGQEILDSLRTRADTRFLADQQQRESQSDDTE